MIQSCGARGIGGAKLAWFHCNSRHVAASSSMRCGVVLVARGGGGALLRRGAVFFIAGRVYGSSGLGVGSVDVFGRDCGRARLSGFCHGLRRVSRNEFVFNDFAIGSMRSKGIAIEVNGCVLEPVGLDDEGSGSLDRPVDHDSDIETCIGSVVLNVQEEVETEIHGYDSVDSPSDLNGDVEAEALDIDEEFISRELILNSQAALSNRPVSRNKMEIEDDSEPLTVWPQIPGEPDRWWRIPDFIKEVLPIPKTFNLQLEILYDKLGCGIYSRELLLRILVHKSYYLSKMPQSIKERKLRKPHMSWQRSETIGDDDLMTFADAHGEARLQLALLGDTVLNLAASHYLIRQHPLLSTGLITERRSQMVCNSNLARAWSTLLGVRELVLCDPPLSQSKKPSATTVLELQMKACADTLEAYIGGVYVEKGLESALQCVETRLLPLLLLAEPTRNPVALLHERCVIELQEKPDYKFIGIDNKNTPNEMCRIRVYVKGFRMSTGIGKSQKLARRDAAEKALLKWSEVFE
ncbi:hypothetical protein KC19_2G143000 [Ceratodon purpureus]|uniref:Uncharacterized protein n=1 Tax=Ceratodon purpureus TaxID=3225 RepID=A0A8T0IVG8_CERPU|nr:hypothetical protein KC19_2G143000 [Ceratodon purpureus]